MPLARAIVLGAAAVALAGSGEPATAVTPASCCETRTYELGTDGSASGPTQVVYTCAGPRPVCGPVIVPAGRWTTTLTVPIGTLVWIQVEKADRGAPGPVPGCWISEGPGHRELTRSSEGVCIVKADPLRPPAGPPSSS